jgi:hypothetical protein
MINRRSVIKAPVCLIPFFGLGISGLAHAKNTLSVGYTPENVTNIEAGIKYIDPMYIKRILKSAKVAIKRKARYEGNKIPLHFNVRLVDKYTQSPLSADFTTLIVSEDFYSPLGTGEDLFISNQSKFTFDTTIPLFKYKPGSNRARSNFYLIVMNKSQAYISRLNISSDFILSDLSS